MKQLDQTLKVNRVTDHTCQVGTDIDDFERYELYHEQAFTG